MLKKLALTGLLLASVSSFSQENHSSGILLKHNHEISDSYRLETRMRYVDEESHIQLRLGKTLLETEQVKLYVNFGQGGGQNGGYSIHLKNKDGYHRYFVNIGKQPRWVNKDNDYISLLPEGGNVEVKLIKLSRNGI